MPPLAPSIIYFDSVGSTNTEASRRAMQGAPEGLCVVADEQTAGRGRLERHWLSPKGAGLYLSVVLRPQLAPNSLPLVTLMSSLAVRDALKASSNFTPDIKWPNDVMANEKKLCGILAEAIETASGRAVVVGIGINLKKGSFPEELAAVATSVEDVTGQPPARDRVLESLMHELSRRYDQLQSLEGEEKIVADWCAASSYANGRCVRIANERETFEGITRGLESDGALRVEAASGDLRIVRAGDVTAVRPNNSP